MPCFGWPWDGISHHFAVASRTSPPKSRLRRGTNRSHASPGARYARDVPPAQPRSAPACRRHLRCRHSALPIPARRTGRGPPGPAAVPAADLPFSTTNLARIYQLDRNITEKPPKRKLLRISHRSKRCPQRNHQNTYFCMFWSRSNFI